MTAAAARTELRVYLPIASLQRQFAAYLAVPTRARSRALGVPIEKER